MINLMDLIEQSEKIKIDIPTDPFVDRFDPSEPIPDDDDDDQNMNEEEWELFQSTLKDHLNNIRTNKLTDQIVDVNEVITELLLMDDETRNKLDHMTDDEINKIKKKLHQKRKSGNVCSMFKNVGIKYLGDRGLLKYQWEKDYYDKHHRKQRKPLIS